jgi:hypothetical protein
VFVACVTLLSAPSWAATPICSVCEAIDNITKQLQALNYSKSDDKVKGEQTVSSALPLLVEFGEVAKTAPDRMQIFNSFLNLSLAAGPYDGEGAFINTLTSEMRSDPILKAAYTKYTKALPQSPQSAAYCNARLLVTSVGNQACFLNARMTGQDSNNPLTSDKAAQCKDTFNYDTCLASPSLK